MTSFPHGKSSIDALEKIVSMFNAFVRCILRTVPAASVVPLLTVGGENLSVLLLVEYSLVSAHLCTLRALSLL